MTDKELSLLIKEMKKTQETLTNRGHDSYHSEDSKDIWAESLSGRIQFVAYFADDLMRHYTLQCLNLMPLIFTQLEKMEEIIKEAKLEDERDIQEAQSA